MPKATVTRLFVGSLIAIVGGLVLLFTAIILGAAYRAFAMNGPDVVGIQPTGVGVGVIVLTATAMLAIIGGGIGQFVAWIGAVLNTAQLQDKTWFLVLLFLGVLSFGFVAMLLYVLAGPTRRGESQFSNRPAGPGLRTRAPSCEGSTGGRTTLGSGAWVRPNGQHALRQCPPAATPLQRRP
jgi:hypothetical protein